MELADSFMTFDGKEQLTVAHVPVAENWVRLPQTFVNDFLQKSVPLPAVLRLSILSEVEKGSRKCAYVTWQGHASQRVKSIEVPLALAKCLRLNDGDQVQIEIVSDVPTAITVHLSAASPEDWDIIEANAEYLHTNVLKQAKVVQEGTQLPIWIRGQSTVQLKVQSASPASVVCLANDTILSIQPFLPDMTEVKSTSGALEAPGASNADTDSSATHVAPAGALAASPGIGESLADSSDQTLPGVSGRLDVSELLAAVNLNAKGPTLPGIQKVMDKKAPPDGPFRLRVKVVLGVFVSSNFANTTGLTHGKPYYIQTKPKAQSGQDILVPVYLHADVPTGHMCLSEPLMKQLALAENSQIWLRKQFSNRASASRLKQVVVSRLHEWSMEDMPDGAANAASAPADAATADSEDETEEEQLDTFVRHCVQQDCQSLLQAVAATPFGAPVKAAVARSENRGGEAASTGSALASDIPVSQLGLRALLSAWLQAQIDFLVALEQSQATKLAPALLCPTAMPMTLCPPLGVNSVYLLSLRDPPYSSSLYALTPEDLNGGVPKLEIEVGTPTQVPISNPIMHFRTWARDIFWKAPPHALPRSETTLDELLPQGKDWLDKEMCEALRVAMPYLSIHAQTFWRSSNVPPPGGILVSGSRGCGKSALLARIAAFLAHHPSTMCHVSRVPCRALAGDKMKRIAKWLQNALITALTHAPAVLLMDDIDSLMPVIPEHAPPQDQHQMEFVIEFMAETIDWLQFKAAESGSPVMIVASCTDASKLPKLLRRTGRLDHHIEVGTPSTQERAGMLAHMLTVRGVHFDRSVLEHIARKTEGYDAADLNVLIERAVHSVRLGALVARPGGLLQVTQAHWDEALAEFQPSAAWEAGADGAVDASVTGWQDVGGMSEATAALKESIELPIRFAKLVAKAPLRMRTGVLLYGPPGCGKTHVVRAAVAAAGVRFVGVKGPELLNKYIGASEEAVRGVFARAQAAAPCVLFFDEFDSIAPQRGSGSDSTGVTERVVNQLLTELDGVERLEGVCVVAASNRPDLIDNALLRPGRLDRLIYCGFPDASERESVFRALFRKVDCAAEVDFGGLAQATEGFSGADLRAIVSEAQLAAVHRHLEVLQAAEAQSGVPDKHGQHTMPKVAPEDIMAALGNARPSLNAYDRASLHQRYQKFMQSREGGSKPFSAESEAAKRALTEQKNKVALG